MLQKTIRKVCAMVKNYRYHKRSNSPKKEGSLPQVAISWTAVVGTSFYSPRDCCLVAMRFHPQLYPLVQILSCLVPKNQIAMAKMPDSRHQNSSQQTNRWRPGGYIHFFDTVCGADSSTEASWSQVLLHLKTTRVKSVMKLLLSNLKTKLSACSGISF